MGVVLKKLPHPYKLTHKITSKKREEAFFVVGLLERGKRIFLEFLGYFS